MNLGSVRPARLLVVVGLDDDEALQLVPESLP